MNGSWTDCLHTLVWDEGMSTQHRIMLEQGGGVAALWRWKYGGEDLRHGAPRCAMRIRRRMRQVRTVERRGTKVGLGA